MEVWKIIFLCKWVICRFHVNLPQGEFMVAFAWNTVIHEVLLDGWSHATCWHALAARYHFVCCLGWFCATTETWKILKDLSILVYFFEMDNQFESISWSLWNNPSRWPDFGKTDWRMSNFLKNDRLVVSICFLTLPQAYIRVCSRWLFTFYHGKSKLNHHLGKMIPFDTRRAPKLSWTYGRYNLSCEVKLKLT